MNYNGRKNASSSAKQIALDTSRILIFRGTFIFCALVNCKKSIQSSLFFKVILKEWFKHLQMTMETFSCPFNNLKKSVKINQKSGINNQVFPFCSPFFRENDCQYADSWLLSMSKLFQGLDQQTYFLPQASASASRAPT